MDSSVIPWEVKEAKRYYNTKSVRQWRQQLTLNRRQKEVLVGTLLGDACLLSNYGGVNYRLQVEQSEAQKLLVDWKHSVFEEFVLSPPKQVVANNSWRFRTISHPELTDFYEQFYRDGKKVVPDSIRVLLSPLGLAVWLMDDGAWDARKEGFTFNSQNFTWTDNYRLKLCLEKRFGVYPVSIHKDKRCYRLYVNRLGVPKLNKIVSQYVISSMRYKLL